MTRSEANRGRTRGARGGARSGMTVLEVLLAAVVSTIVTLGAAAAFSENLEGAAHARRSTAGALFLETIEESLAAQDASNLLALDGDTYLNGATEDTSEFRVDLRVFQAELGLLQVELQLVDLRSDRTMGRLTTLRSSR